MIGSVLGQEHHLLGDRLRVRLDLRSRDANASARVRPCPAPQQTRAGACGEKPKRPDAEPEGNANDACQSLHLRFFSRPLGNNELSLSLASDSRIITVFPPGTKHISHGQRKRPENAGSQARHFRPRCLIQPFTLIDVPLVASFLSMIRLNRSLFRFGESEAVLPISMREPFHASTIPDLVGVCLAVAVDACPASRTCGLKTEHGRPGRPKNAIKKDDPTAAARNRMVQRHLVERGIKNPRVLDAFRTVPRHLFLPPNTQRQAYDDESIPIGEGQTITPPYDVAFMTEILEPKPTDKVYEVGTGSGYQSAILSRLVKEVYSVEIHEPLSKRATKVHQDLGYTNIHTRVGDGYVGWPEAAPFDAIIVTCAPTKVPQPLFDQLKEGGRMVIPIGDRFNQIRPPHHQERRQTGR